MLIKMSKITIKAGVISEALKLVQAEGQNVKGEKRALLKDCIINVEKDNVLIKSIDEDESLITRIEFKKGKVTVKEAGDIPIEFEDSMPTLKRFGDDNDIDMVYDGQKNYYSRSKPKKLSYDNPVCAVDAIGSIMNEELPFVFDAKTNTWSALDKSVVLNVYMEIDAKEFKEIITDGDQLEHRNFPFVVSNNTVVVTVEDSGSEKHGTRELEVKKIVSPKDAASIYSYGFGNAFAHLSGLLKIWMCNDGPMIIQKEYTDFELTYILATTVLEEEQDEGESAEESGDQSANVENLDKAIDEAVAGDKEEAEGEEEGEEEAEEAEEPEPEPKPEPVKKSIKSIKATKRSTK